MRSDNEKVLDAQQWRVEAQSVIDDVKEHVHELRVCSDLSSSNSSIYLNLTTLEGCKFCISLSAEGFGVIGNQHETNDQEPVEYFETVYSLLDHLSPQYRDSFGKSLMQRLQMLDNVDR
ncbi:hypothetical protein QAD02_012095 [Eretmocerus hayati]|uniref:Uncharacterized protein n=1 Tax=Eretmocerus hayati TaxID=131215 RepID=A0ACC2NZL1_9HYME|nr:hypothetical protein QAD02_012095 [Eretmocerus hayati]